VFKAADHEFVEDKDPGAGNASSTVDHHRGVKALGGVQHAVSVSPQ
jgi:hypothetical protein